MKHHKYIRNGSTYRYTVGSIPAVVARIKAHFDMGGGGGPGKGTSEASKQSSSADHKPATVAPTPK